MKKLEAEAFWQKIQINSFYGGYTYTEKKFESLYEQRVQTNKKIRTIKRRVNKIQNIFNEQG